MRKNNEKIDRVERLLAAIHESRPAPQPTESWHHDVLRRVRGAALDRQEGFWPDRRIWRVAWTMAAAALIVTLLALQIGFTPDQEIMSLLSEYPPELTQPLSFGL